MAKRLVARDAGAAPSALDELLDAEREMAARNAEVARECEAILDNARAAAKAMEADAASALAAELLALDEASGRVRDELVRQIEADAARALARYEQLGDDEITRLAELIASRVTGLAGMPPEQVTA